MGLAAQSGYGDGWGRRGVYARGGWVMGAGWGGTRGVEDGGTRRQVGLWE